MVKGTVVLPDDARRTSNTRSRTPGRATRAKPPVEPSTGPASMIALVAEGNCTCFSHTEVAPEVTVTFSRPDPASALTLTAGRGEQDGPTAVATLIRPASHR